MPQFRGLGPRFKTCKPVALTEEGLEYVVTVVKHVFETHVVLQFNCTNTFKEQVRSRQRSIELQQHARISKAYLAAVVRRPAMSTARVMQRMER